MIWFLSYFGFVDGAFTMLSEDQLDSSILASIGGAVAWIFAPLGFGSWQATVASVTGLVAKENIVATMGIVFGGENVYATIAASFTALSGYAFLTFNLLCAPCFAAMGAIKREMNSAKWFWIAIGYQCVFAYLVSLCIYQFGMLFTGHFGIGDRGRHHRLHRLCLPAGPPRRPEEGPEGPGGCQGVTGYRTQRSEIRPEEGFL